MKRKLIFATNNANKLQEIEHYLGDSIHILSLKDIGFSGDIPETGETLEANASQKARFIYEQFHMDCFADDTGLEIEALDGRPGVYSARYAGPDCHPDDNIRKALQEMNGEKNRKARFRTVISLIINNKENQFDGVVEGTILSEKTGTSGFGYDPIFQPQGYDKSFAQMTLKEKNRISHRGKAVRKLVNYLNAL